MNDYKFVFDLLEIKEKDLLKGVWKDIYWDMVIGFLQKEGPSLLELSKTGNSTITDTVLERYSWIDSASVKEKILRYCTDIHYLAIKEIEKAVILRCQEHIKVNKKEINYYLAILEFHLNYKYDAFTKIEGASVACRIKETLKKHSRFYDAFYIELKFQRLLRRVMKDTMYPIKSITSIF